MSTRCQVIIKDADEELWFYRHSDGYPEGALPSLKQFVDYIATGAIRDNVGQNAGWLVIIGHVEYEGKLAPGSDGLSGWKVGAYEPCAPVKHGDIEYLYTVDCQALSVVVRPITGFGEDQKLGRAKILYTAKRKGG